MKSDNPLVWFGIRLRELRQSNDLSQEELAARANLDRTYISSCERGKRNISLINIYKIANALKVEPSQLVQKTK